MTEQTPNIELAYKALDHIDAHPEQWDQGIWIIESECGTVGCFAGWAVLLAGGTVGLTAGRYDPVVTGGPEGIVGLIVDDAAEVLLRSDCIAGNRDLFDPHNTRGDLGRLVAEIFGPRPGASDVVD
jgi:hypothetical protein